MSPPSFEVAYAPEVVFSGDPLTVQLSAQAPTTVSVASNPRTQQSLTLRPAEQKEVTLRIRETSRLRISDPLQTYTFRVTAPNPLSVFTEQDGFLHENGEPVILLPTHRQPPPLDRRWQTVDEISRRVVDRREAIEKLLWVGHDAKTLQTLSPRLTQAPPHHLKPHADAWFPLHGYLLAPSPETADFLVLEIDARDFERGMSPHEWLMKWHFTLQTLEARSGVSRGILLGPVPDPETQPWMNWFQENLPALASAHGLIYVDRSLPEPTWRERLFHRLEREFLLP